MMNLITALYITVLMLTTINLEHRVTVLEHAIDGAIQSGVINNGKE